MSSSGVKQKVHVNHGVDFWKDPPQNITAFSLVVEDRRVMRSMERWRSSYRGSFI